MTNKLVTGLSVKRFARLATTLFIAIVVLSSTMSGKMTLHAAAVDPSVEIIGVLANPFCSSTDGQLLSQIGNTTIPASFRMEFFAPGFGQVYNVVLNFSTSGNQNFTGFAVSPFSLAPNTPFTMRTTTYDAPGGAGNVTFISELVFNCSTGATISLTNGVPSVVAAPLPLFTDGRENKNDAIQTAAVYCDVPNAGDVRVYALFNNVGYLAFTVTKAELAAGVQKPATPYLIKSAKGAELWRLQDGSLRIKRGTYVFDWPGC
jgi:hypothetical protein